MFDLSRFRAEFDAAMAQLRDNILELGRVGAELHRRVDSFCRG